MIRRTPTTAPPHRVSLRRSPTVGAASGSWWGWGIAGIIVVGGLFYLTWSVFSMLFAAVVFAWLLNPAVTALEPRVRSREWACILVFAMLTTFAIALVVGVLPRVVGQIAELSGKIQPYVQRLSENVWPYIAMAESRFGIRIPLNPNDLATQAPALLQKISPDVRARIQEWLQSAASGSLSVVLSALSLSLLPLFTFYLVRDWPKLVAGVEELVPPRHRPIVRELSGQIDTRLSGFVRGQLTVALVLGCVYTVGQLIAGIDLAVTVGMLGGALFLLPYIGTLVAAALAGVLALMKFGLDWHVAVAVGTFFVGQAIEGAVLTPWLVGDRVGLHPMVVMVALIVGGNLLGIWGLVLAVPMTAALAVVGGHLMERWRSSKTFGT